MQYTQACGRLRPSRLCPRAMAGLPSQGAYTVYGLPGSDAETAQSADARRQARRRGAGRSDRRRRLPEARRKVEGGQGQGPCRAPVEQGWAVRAPRGSQPARRSPRPRPKGHSEYSTAVASRPAGAGPSLHGPCQEAGASVHACLFVRIRGRPPPAEVSARHRADSRTKASIPVCYPRGYYAWIHR